MVVARQAMPKHIPMNVSLTAELASFVSEKVASGRYGSASEVVRTSLACVGGKGASLPTYVQHHKPGGHSSP